MLLAHELAHVVQQNGSYHVQGSSAVAISSPADAAEREAAEIGSSFQPGRAEDGVPTPVHPRANAGQAHLLRAWEAPGTKDCSDVPTGSWLRNVVINQEGNQTVTLGWSDGKTESGVVSTGKGHCCVDASAPEGVACSTSGSRLDGSNCTPIGGGFTITDRFLSHNGWPFWSTFVPDRGIGLHGYPTVTGKPISHGCVRMHEQTARHIFCGARRNRTTVEVKGFARPDCADPVLRAEWQEDFEAAGRRASDGDAPPDRRTIDQNRRESRRILSEAYGRRLSESEIKAGLTALDIPRCRRRAPLPEPPK
jgi:hypothetical protein